MTKKGQGISINTIIIAAIALAVLVVLFAIFTGRLGSFSTGVSKTATCENTCKALNKEIQRNAEESTCKNTQGYDYIAGTYSDVTSGVCCCKPK